MTDHKHRAYMVYYVFIRKKDLGTGSLMVFMAYGEPKGLYSRSTNQCKRNPLPSPQAYHQSADLFGLLQGAIEQSLSW